MPVKIKDFVTRDTKVLMQTFNTAPKLECIIQNQLLLLEALCDVRKELLEVLFRTDWLAKATPLKKAKVEAEKEEPAPTLSRRAESKLSFEERVKVISDRTAKEEAFTKEEEVEAF